MDMQPLLEVRGLCKEFPGVKALDAVNFTLYPGSVHAVCGENGAGKSTLMNILMGLYQRDSGDIVYKGQPINFATPRQALKAGISIIEQELNPVSEMTVAENLYLGREDIHHGIWIDKKTMEKRAEKELASLQVSINPKSKIKHLSLAQIQLMEIVKAISYNSDIIIMDEPTSAIPEKDAEKLFSVIETLKASGKGIIYVSHRMKEIFTISDTITVLRDGQYIGTRKTKEIDLRELVSLMIGRRLEDEYVKENVPSTVPYLQVNKLNRKGAFSDINLTVHRGEILGLFGLMGSGRSEFFDALFGVHPAEMGELFIEGNPVSITNPSEAKYNRIAYVTEDRKLSGLVLKCSVKDNISLPSIRRLSHGLFISKHEEMREVKAIAERMRVKTPSLRQQVSRLSGGNQQKVVLCKWLLTQPSLLLLDEPTRGIDVGAKREIYAFMSEFAKAGNAIIMISSELPEIMQMSDRIAVFREGRVVAIKNRTQFSQDSLMSLASYDLGEE